MTIRSSASPRRGANLALLFRNSAWDTDEIPASSGGCVFNERIVIRFPSWEVLSKE
jgi:hypothetical protein